MSWWPQSTMSGTGSVESNLAGVWETQGTTHSSFGSLPERGDTTVPSTKLWMEDWLIGQDASPIEAATQTASTTTLVVELTSPIVPPNWTEEEKQYVLIVTTSVRSLNLETTAVVLGDTVTTSAWGGAFQKPRANSRKRGNWQTMCHDEGTRGEWCRVKIPYRTRPWLPLGGGVGWWPPLGRRIETPLGRNHSLYFCFSYFCFSYMSWQLLAFTS